jgi:trans-aconitate methyltransferase
MTEVLWPKINGEPVTWKVKMKKEYFIEDMGYLDSMVARPIFDKQADIIAENKSKGIVDIGCRMGMVNTLLKDIGYTDYHYMGFDTSPIPIEQANKDWKEYPNIEYRVGTWDNEEVLKVDFDVDTLIMSGVLIYCQPCHKEFYEESGYHTDLFDRLVSYYKPKNVIIQETLSEQKHIHPDNNHETIDLSYYKSFDHKFYEFDLDMWLGHRAVIDVRLPS